MKNKTEKKITRPTFTNEELERMTIDELARTPFKEEEKVQLREINRLRRQAIAKAAASARQEAAPLLAELRAHGFEELESVADLVNRSEPYPAAIPILLKHLTRPYYDIVRSTIARSLAVPEPAVRAAWPLLVEEYKKAPMGTDIRAPGETKKFHLDIRDALACVLCVAVTPQTLPELIELLKDPAQGESRILLLDAIRRKRKRDPAIQQLLAELVQDPQLAKEINSWRKL